jgi:hypothetical protein
MELSIVAIHFSDNPEDAVTVAVKVIKGCQMFHQQKQYQAAGDAEREARDV